MSAPRLASDMIETRRAFVQDAISRASQRTGVDFDYLLNQAKSESGLNPAAKATTSSASGLFQFIDQTWLGVIKQHGAKHGMAWAANAVERGPGGRWAVRDPTMRQAVFALRNQAEPAALMAAESASENAQGLTAALGRQATKADLYFAHFLGLAGAKRFLRAREASPGATAAALFPREASVNRGLFYTRAGDARSMDDLYQLMARKITGGRSEGAAPVAKDLGASLQMAKAGDLVPVPEGSPDGDLVRVLSAENMPPSTAGPDGDTQSETMMALMQGRSGLNVLRPSPQTARLAYLLLAADLRDPNVTT